MISGLNKIDFESKSFGPTGITQSLPPINVPQPATIAGASVGSSANQVKRKPVGGTVSSTRNRAPQLESRNDSTPGVALNTASTLPAPYPVQTALSASTHQNLQHAYHLVPDQSNIRPPGDLPRPQGSRPPERPPLLTHARTEPSPRYIAQNRTPQPSQQRPHLQHIRTAPADPLHGQGQASNAVRNKSRPKFTRGNRRASVVAAAKTLSHNRWVQAGAKMGAKIALGAVIGDAASSLTVNGGVGIASALGSLWTNNGSGGGDAGDPNDITAPSLFGVDTGSNNDDTGLWNDNENASTADVSNTDYTAPGFGTTDNLDYTAPGFGSPTDLASTEYTGPGFTNNNDSSFTDLSNTAGNHDTTSSPDFSGPAFAQQSPFPDASYTDPTHLYESGGAAAQNYANAQAGLSTAQYNQSVAVDAGASAAISASQAYTVDAVDNASYGLAYGPDAIPGQAAGAYSVDDG